MLESESAIAAADLMRFAGRSDGLGEPRRRLICSLGLEEEDEVTIVIPLVTRDIVEETGTRDRSGL